MEKKISKLLENKYENVVQFNVTNNSFNPIYVDLFNTANLTPVNTNPNIIPAYTNVSTVNPVLNSIMEINPINNTIYCAESSSNTVLVFDSTSFSFITSISTGATTIYDIKYCSVNNFMYLTTSPTTGLGLALIDCNTNTYLGNIPSPSINELFTNLVYSEDDNLMYVTSYDSVTLDESIYVFDCGTNTYVNNSIYTTGLGSSSIISMSNLTSLNSIYIYDNNLGFLQKYNANTNTFVLLNISIVQANSMLFNASNNFLYCTESNVGGGISVINTITDSFDGVISLIPNTGLLRPTYLALNPTTNQLFATTQFTTSQYSIVDCNTNTFVQTNVLQVGFGNLVSCIFNPINSLLYINGNSNIYGVTTMAITTDPYYILGSTNYNTFVNNLNNEPIEIQMIRLFVENQEQLYNQFQLTKIDSNGNQIFLPDFPINQVSIMQQQGNIGEISLKDVVFDGRTYINQYKINGYETISFEIYYTQLDLTSATPILPIFFKPKIQLKEYINKELNL